MVIFDRRDDFADSDSNLDTVAAEAHGLYASDEFQDRVAEQLGPVVKEFIDCEAVDAAAEQTIREFMASEALGALFQLRNQIVTNRDADLEEGDVIRMESARDSDETVLYVVDRAHPDDTGVHVWRVPDSEDDDPKASDHGAGHVKYCERFEVDRSYRDLDKRPFRVARQLARGELGDADE